MAKVPFDQRLGYRVEECVGNPLGRTKLYEFMKNGRLKSKLVDGVRVIDGKSYRDLICVKDEETAA